jgi:hypothetical protein
MRQPLFFWSWASPHSRQYTTDIDWRRSSSSSAAAVSPLHYSCKERAGLNADISADRASSAA